MIVAEIITETTRTTLADVGLIVGAATAVGAVGLRWLRREISAQVQAHHRDIHRALDEMRRDMRPNGGTSSADLIATQTATQVAHLVAELLRRRTPDDPT